MKQCSLRRVNIELLFSTSNFMRLKVRMFREMKDLSSSAKLKSSDLNIFKYIFGNFCFLCVTIAFKLLPGVLYLT